MRFMANLLVGMMILCAALAVVPPAAQAGPGDTIRINEIMYNPIWPKLDGEWIELHNYGDLPVNVKNWSVLDQESDDLAAGNVDFVFPDLEFPAGGFALIHTGPGTNSTGFVDGRADFYMGKTSTIWSPSGDDCLLTNATGYPIDFVSYGQWDGTYVDPCPPELDITHTNATAEEGYSISLCDSGFLESFPSPLEPNGQDLAPPILITEVYYDTWGENEFFTVANPGTEPVDISFWHFTDGEGVVAFPAGTTIAGGQSMTIAQNASNYQSATLNVPDFEYFNLSDAVDMLIIDYEPALANGGDELFLLNQYRRQVDAFVYGDSEYEAVGWESAPAPNLSQGCIAKRLLLSDTNTSEDWVSTRPYVIGQSDFEAETFSVQGQMDLFSSPDSSFKRVAGLIDNASQSIDINLYEFTNTDLADRLELAVLRGVDVRLFVEGSPVGGINQTQFFIMRQLADAGAQVRILTNDPANDIHARYDYDHAKYAVFDSEILLMMSENWGYSGVPEPGKQGNRGWGAAINDDDLAEYFTQVFDQDWNPERSDSVAYDSSHESWDAGHDWTGNHTDIQNHFPAKSITSSSEIIPVLSPDTSLSEDTILGMIDSAQERLLVEQFYAYKHWGDRATGSPETTPDIYLESVLNAARRGCRVRVLLDSTYYNIEDSDPVDNDDAVEYLNTAAAAESLDLEAKLVNLEEHEFTKIHNKGMIADNSVLISSINWNLNSVTENREAGIILKNQEAADYFKGIFEYDWKDDTTPPLAQFTNQGEYQVNSTFTIYGNSSFDNVGIVNYTWYVDGAPYSWGENFTGNFSALGMLNLNLTVLDAWGNAGWHESSFSIIETAPEENTDTVQDSTENQTNNPTDDNSTSEPAEDNMAEVMGILLLVPLFIFVAVVYVLWVRNR